MYENIQSIRMSELALPLFIISFAINHNPVSYMSPNGRSSYQWIYCVRGIGELLAGHEKVILEKGFGYLLLPDTAYGFTARSVDWALDFIEFGGEICEELLNSLGMAANTTYYFGDQSIFHTKILRLKELSEKRPFPEPEIFSTICYELLLSIRKCIYHSAHIKSISVLGNDAVMQISEIAKMCGYDDAGYFGKVFRKIEGMTPDQYRRQENLFQ